MSKQNENTNKDTEIIKRDSTKILENSTVTEMKNSLGQFSSRLEQAKEGLSKLEVRIIEIIPSKEQKNGEK